MEKTDAECSLLLARANYLQHLIKESPWDSDHIRLISEKLLHMRETYGDETWNMCSENVRQSYEKALEEFLAWLDKQK